jgi:hypothetical protein
MSTKGVITCDEHISACYEPLISAFYAHFEANQLHCAWHPFLCCTFWKIEWAGASLKKLKICWVSQDALIPKMRKDMDSKVTNSSSKQGKKKSHEDVRDFP